MSEHQPAEAQTPITIRSESDASLVVYRTQRTLVVHWLTEGEIDYLAESKSGIYLTFLGLAVGGMISIAITLATVHDLTPKASGSFVGALIASTALAVLFGVLAWLDVRRTRLAVRTLKQGQRLKVLDADAIRAPR